MSDGRFSLGTFFIFTGISLILVLRGGPNDLYAGVLVFLIALLQLLEYGVYTDIQCSPGQSNTKASKGAYILLWAMPATLCLAAAYLATDVSFDVTGRSFLLGAGLMYLALVGSVAALTYKDGLNWCSSMGNLWQPIWYFQNEKVPFQLNYLWLVGILVPTLLVDPMFLGVGTLAAIGGSYAVGRYSDPLGAGEWLSITSLLANSVAIWTVVVPSVRELLLGPGGGQF
jgi:hypothetical protein